MQIFDKNLNWEVLNQSMPGWELYEYYDKGDQYSYGFNGIEANVTAQLPTVSLIENGPARAQLQFQYQVGIQFIIGLFHFMMACIELMLMKK